MDTTDLNNAGIPSLTLQQLRKMTHNFSLERLLGEGGFGKVYLGLRQDGEKIAVKVFLYSMDSSHVNRFKNELHKLAMVEHQNIIKLVAYCCETERKFMQCNGKLICAEEIHMALCFTYAHNGSLKMHLSDEQHGFDWPTRYKIIKGMCEGLKYLHHGLTPNHILHLDINPSNILLDENMEPKLSDFVISRFLNDDKKHRTTERLFGTRGYLAPEYIYSGEFSKKSDIFSLGVVMLEIVTGYIHYPDTPCDYEEFIDLVHGEWRSIFQLEFRGSTLDAYCGQVKRCTEIVLDCVQNDSHKRPDIVDIIIKLNETEAHRGFEDIQIWRMPFNALKTITDDFKTEIGKGAFGTVYKGQLANGEIVAVKRLKPHSENPRKQIESEEHLKNLEHENIVRLIGFCHETKPEPVPDPSNPGKYIVMDVTESLLCYEFLPNGSLEDKMWSDKSSTLDWRTRYSVIQGICKGLHYLHQGCQNAPIVHRDLKPGNVLLDANMVPKLGDFGLSRIVPKSRPHITLAVGSSGYLAPETIRDNKFSKITPKSDIYSLGVLILEIVTGEKCPDNELSGRDYIQKVREARKQSSYVASRYPSLDDRLLQQVDSWINIGLRCVEELPERRAPIEHIMHFLETESANSAETREETVCKISFKELEDITEKFSRQFGESIFGDVYQGTRVNGDGIIVFKLEQQKRLSPGQFTSEVSRMSLKHKNILQLKGYCEEIHSGEVKERLLCYEFFRNGSLGEIIYEDECLTLRLDWEARYKIIQGICHSLKYLHEECEDRPQVHMAITPANIWLDDEMVPKLGACGLSRLFGADYTQIYNQEIVESRGYVAPEHVELTKLSTKSDIYSLGVLIIEIVTGQKCPSGDNGSAASFIANVRKTWMKDLQIKSKYPSLDTDCLQQVKGCIKVGVQCAEISPEKRLTAGEIIPMLERECTGKPGFWNALCPGICSNA